VLCSGYGEEEATRSFAGTGLAGFLQKPYDAATLAETVVRHLEAGGTPRASRFPPDPA